MSVLKHYPLKGFPHGNYRVIKNFCKASVLAVETPIMQAYSTFMCLGFSCIQ